MQIINAFGKRDWKVAEVPHESLLASDGKVLGRDESNDRKKPILFDISDSELIWMFGFGPKETFLDRMQMLNALPVQKFVNTVDAFVFRHAKHGVLFSDAKFKQPRTIVSDSPQLLYSTLQRGGDWVIKPSAGSFGIGVCQINKDDPNANSIIELTVKGGYALLQERVETREEKRWLIANGRMIGVYAKRFDGVRGNLSSGMQPVVVKRVTDKERKLIAQAIDDLTHMGIRYAAIDVAFPYVLDVNFVNPGWLATYEELTGENLALEVAAAFAD